MPNTRSASIPWRAVLLAILWVGLGLSAGYLLGSTVNALWPAPIRTLTFTDLEHGGRSSVRIDTANKLLRMSVRLDSGAPYPVAGGILFLGTDSSVVDMSGPGQLELDLGPSDIPAITICLVEDLPGFTRNDAWQTARYECSALELLPGTSAYRIPLDKFVTPPWWYVTSGLRLSQIGPEKRSRIVRMIAQTAEGTALGKSFELRVRSISVRENHPWILLAGLCAGLALALLQLAWSIRGGRRPAVVAVAPTHQVVFQPVEAKSYADREREAVVECIGRDYPDSELSLEKVSRSTGVPQDRVTSHVKAASGLLFKAYLNRVRGEAAHKLLLETDLPVSEVAQRVGYGSIAHFNRVFREHYDTTPTALREGTPPEPIDRSEDAEG